MVFDAVILAGGRGSRLGGVSKPRLLRNNTTLLKLALRAAAGARRVIVVGDVEAASGFEVTRETPTFGGPVAAVAAGVSLLSPAPGDFTLVLACDIPDSATAVRALRRHRETSGAPDGSLAVDATGRRQFLLALYSTSSLAARLASMPVDGASMGQLVQGMQLDEVAMPPGSTNDVDTWEDAEALGVTR